MSVTTILVCHFKKVAAPVVSAARRAASAVSSSRPPVPRPRRVATSSAGAASVSTARRAAQIILVCTAVSAPFLVLPPADPPPPKPQPQQVVSPPFYVPGPPITFGIFPPTFGFPTDDISVVLPPPETGVSEPSSFAIFFLALFSLLFVKPLLRYLKKILIIKKIISI